jgi:hypothetical protein
LLCPSHDLIMDHKAQTGIAQMGDFCLTHMS